MRRTLSAIFVLLIFCTLQYGNIATYLYCKWQADFIQKATNCGCETHLSNMFQENGSQGISTTVIKEITVEYFHSIPVSVLPVTGNPEVISHFAEYDFLLPQYYLSPAFRPPSI